jgi:hypothetical protein
MKGSIVSDLGLGIRCFDFDFWRYEYLHDPQHRAFKLKSERRGSSMLFVDRQKIVRYETGQRPLVRCKLDIFSRHQCSLRIGYMITQVK